MRVTIGRIAQQELPCSKCGAKKKKPCVTSSGAEYQDGLVHAVRYKEAVKSLTPDQVSLLESPPHPDNWQPEAQTEPSVNVESLIVASRANREERIKMVRSVFRMLVKFDGIDRTLERMAELFVEYDVDETMIWESRRDDGKV